MRKLLLIGLVLITLNIQGCNISNNVIVTKNYEGVILSINGEQNWTPNKEIIDEFETKLTPYLNNFISRQGNVIYCNEDSLVFVKENIKKYKRQYIGKFIDGKKILYCNCLFIGNSKYESRNWKKNVIFVDDGGPHYFQINYDVESKEIFGLSINGYA